MSRFKDNYYGDDSVDDLRDEDTDTDVYDPLLDGRSHRPLNLDRTAERGPLSGKGFVEDFEEVLDTVMTPIEREDLFVDTLIEMEDLEDEGF